MNVCIDTQGFDISMGTGSMIFLPGGGLRGNISILGNVAFGKLISTAALDISGTTKTNTIDTQNFDISMGTGLIRFASTSTGAIGGLRGNIFINGNVGIGKSTPTAALDISGSIFSSGGIGIGTTNLIAELDVRGQIYSTGEINTTNSIWAGSTIEATDSSIIGATTSGTGYIMIRAVGSANYIQSGVSDTPSSSAPLYFTNINATNTWMTIATNGNVGIGNTTPTATLDVSGIVKSNIIDTGLLRIVEQTGTVGDQNTGSILIDHENAGGTSSIVFRSKNNRGSDYGYIRYKDDVNNGTGLAENARLEIGLENDIGNDYLILQKNGSRVGIGTSTPAVQLDLSTDGARKLSTTAWTTGSDRRIKEDITDADLDLCYSVIKNLKLRRFKWKDYVGYEHDKHVVGYIAQEVKDVFPKAVTESKNVLKKKNENGEIVEEEIEDFLTLNVDQIQKTLHGAIQKLMKIVEQQQIEIDTLIRGNYVSP